MVELTKLRNGLRVVYFPDKSQRTTGFCLAIGAGAIHEGMSKKNLSTLGLAHFNEHMFFKSNKYKNYYDILTRLDWSGTDYNAITELWCTHFNGFTFSENIEEVLEILYECYTNYDFSKEEFENEKGVITGEIISEENNMNDFMFYNLLLPTLFENTHLNRNLIGNKDTLKKITIEDLVRFKKKHYIPQKTVLGLSGCFDMRSLKPYLESTFGSIERGKIRKLNYKLNTKPNYEIIQKKYGQGKSRSAFLLVGFLAPRENENQTLLARFLQQLLSGGYSSRVDMVIKEEKGKLIQGYDVSANYYEDYGCLTIELNSFNANNIKNARNAVNQMIDNIIKKGFSNEEVKGVKKICLKNNLKRKKNMGKIAKSIALTELLKKRYNIFDYDAKIKQITKNQINNYAKKIFSQKKVEIIVKQS